MSAVTNHPNPGNEPYIAPLTEQQARELARANSSGMARVAAGYLVDGFLDVKRLKMAIQAVTNEHAALRTAVISNEQADFQLVFPWVEAPLYELEGRPAEQTVLGVLNFIERHLGKDCIRLNKAPMWFLCVVRIAPGRHIVLGLCSRMVMDYQAIAVMFRHVLSRYLNLPAHPTTQYDDYANLQDTWRRDQRTEWLNTWMQRVDFNLPVSARGRFPRSDTNTSAIAHDTFSLPHKAMAVIREFAKRNGHELVQVLTAVLAMVDQEESGNREHRFVIAQTGLDGIDSRAIGAYQLNCLIAFTLDEKSAFEVALSRAMEAWEFEAANQGTGVESLIEGLLEPHGGSVLIPFRISLHIGVPPPPPELPAGLPLDIQFLPNPVERTAPLDTHTEGSVMFVFGHEIDAILVSWWDEGPRASFYSSLWTTFGARLEKLASTLSAGSRP